MIGNVGPAIATVATWVAAWFALVEQHEGAANVLSAWVWIICALSMLGLMHIVAKPDEATALPSKPSPTWWRYVVRTGSAVMAIGMFYRGWFVIGPVWLLAMLLSYFARAERLKIEAGVKA